MKLSEIKHLIQESIDSSLQIYLSEIPPHDYVRFCFYLFRRIEHQLNASDLSQRKFVQTLSLTHCIQISHPLVLLKQAILFYRGFLKFHNHKYIHQAVHILDRVCSLHHKRISWAAHVYLLEYTHTRQHHVLEKALNYFEDALIYSAPEDSHEVLQQSVYAWLYSADMSKEPYDLYQADGLLSCMMPLDFPPLDRYYVWFLLGSQTWNIDYLDALITRLLQDPRDHKRKWMILLQAYTERCYFIDSIDFPKIEETFIHVITRFPQEESFWMMYIVFLVTAGKILASSDVLESAIEKLVSMKSLECSPVKVSCLLIEALMALGLLTEDDGMICSAIRQHAKLEQEVKQDPLSYTELYLRYGKGVFFHDSLELRRTLKHLHKALQKDPFSLKLRYLEAETLYHLTCSSRDERVSKLAYDQLSYILGFVHNDQLLLLFVDLCLMVFYQTKMPMYLEQALSYLKNQIQTKPSPQFFFHIVLVLFLYAESCEDPSLYTELFEYYYQYSLEDPFCIKIHAHIHILYGLREGNLHYVQHGIHLLEDILKYDPHHEQMIEDLGVAYLALFFLSFKKKDLVKSCQILTQAYGLGCDAALFPLAWIYHRLGLNKQSVLLEQKALRYKAHYQIEPCFLYQRIMNIFLNRGNKTC